jgi:hypothetical protein
MNASLLKSVIKYINEMYSPSDIKVVENESYPDIINQYILIVKFDSLETIPIADLPIEVSPKYHGTSIEELINSLRIKLMKRTIREDIQKFFGVHTTGFYVEDKFEMPPYREHELRIEVSTLDQDTFFF